MEKSYAEILNFNPRSCIGSQVRKLNRILSKKYNDNFSALGVKISQVNILFATSARHGILQSEIANLLILERSTLHRDMKRLLERNLLRLEKNPGVKSPSVYLTDEGKAFVKTLVPVWESTQKEVKKIISPDMIESINQINAQLLEN